MPLKSLMLTFRGSSVRTFSRNGDPQNENIRIPVAASNSLYLTSCEGTGGDAEVRLFLDGQKAYCLLLVDD